MRDESNKPKRTATNLLNTIFCNETLKHKYTNIDGFHVYSAWTIIMKMNMYQYESENECTRKHIICSSKHCSAYYNEIDQRETILS